MGPGASWQEGAFLEEEAGGEDTEMEDASWDAGGASPAPATGKNAPGNPGGRSAVSDEEVDVEAESDLSRPKRSCRSEFPAIEHSAGSPAGCPAADGPSGRCATTNGAMSSFIIRHNGLMECYRDAVYSLDAPHPQSCRMQ